MRVYKRKLKTATVWYGDFGYTDAAGNERRWRKSLGLTAVGPGAFKKAEALAKAREIRQGLHALTALQDAGVYLPGAGVAVDAAPLSGLAKLHLEHRAAHCKPSTIARYNRVVRVYLLPARGGWPGDCDARTLEVTHVRSLQAAMRAGVDRHLSRGGSKTAPYGPSTVNQATTLLGAILQTGVDGGYLTRNVARAAQRIKREQSSWDWYTAAESRRLLEAARTVRSRRFDGWRLLFWTALRTGLRPGELLALRWAQVDLAGRFVVAARTVSIGKGGPEISESTKSSRSRRIPIPEPLALALRGARSLHELVFCAGDGSRLTHKEYNGALERAAKAAGLRVLNPHDLRHSYASQLAAESVPLRRIQELLGHADINQTMRYAHVAPTSLVQDIELLPQIGAAGSN